MKKIIIIILFILLAIVLFIALPINALVYQQGEFLLYGSPEEGWIFLTPKYNYFAIWLGKDLGCMWIERETRLVTCLMIRKGKEAECSMQEISILVSNFPHELIQSLRNWQ